MEHQVLDIPISTKTPFIIDEHEMHLVYNQSSDIPFIHQSILGEGSFGWVDLVKRQDRSGHAKFFARKSIRIRPGQTESQLQSIHNEVSIVNRLRHKHITRVITTYLCKKTFAIIMLPVADVNLKEWMEQIDISDKSQEKQCKLLPKWSQCLANALEYIHDQRVRHKDIKPANILVKGEEVYITDFGIAKDLIEDVSSGTMGTDGLRTRIYSAPEVMTEHARRGRTSDMFSLGCVFLEMITVFLQESLVVFSLLRESRGPEFRAYFASPSEVIEWTEHLLALFECKIQKASISKKWVLMPLLLLRFNPQERPTATELVQQFLALSFGTAARCQSCHKSSTSTADGSNLYNALESYHLSSAHCELRADRLPPRTDEIARRYFLVPYARNSYFVGRESQLRDLKTKIGSLTGHCRVALTGLGGVGKTQLALELTHRLQGHCSVFWVHANNRARLEQSYLAIGQALGIPGIDKLSGAKLMNAVKGWLNEEELGRWLLILDNVDDLEKLVYRTKDDEQHTLFDCLPSQEMGCIVFTTRDRKTGICLAKIDPILVEEFNLDESRKLLESTILSKELLDDEAKATELIGLLEYHPLAIVQAASYISQNQIPLSEYVELYSENVDAQLDLEGTDFLATLRYNLIAPVLSTWLITFEAIQRKEALAAEFLSIICCLERTSIPRWLLPRATGVTSGKVINALGTLRAYSFINMQLDGKSFDVHRLVYQAGRYWLHRGKGLTSWTGKAAIHIERMLPEVFFNEKIKALTLLPHLVCLLDSKYLSLSDPRVEYQLRYKAAWYLMDRADYSRAETMVKKCVTVIEYTLQTAGSQPGLGFEELLAATNWTIECRCFTGDFSGVLQMAREILARTESLDSDNPQVLRCLNNIAFAQRGLEQFAAAEATDRLVLARRRKLLGDEHPHTTKSMSNLAHVLRLRGKLQEAASLLQRAFEIRRRIYGPDNMDTLTTMCNLALVWQDQGRLIEAEATCRAALCIHQKKPLLESDSNQVFTWQCLIAVLKRQERFSEAEEESRKAIEVSNGTFGEGSRETLKLYSSLADVYASQSRLEEAYTLASEMAQRTAETMGIFHPDTLLCQSTLARIYSLRKEWESARKTIFLVLVNRLTGQGWDSPHVAGNVIALATYYLQKPDEPPRPRGAATQV